MDKIEKALQKLSEKERKNIKEILQRLKQHQTIGFNIAKLKGQSGAYRVRKGDLRVLFRYKDDGSIDLLDVDRRSENTYRKF